MFFMRTIKTFELDNYWSVFFLLYNFICYNNYEEHFMNVHGHTFRSSNPVILNLWPRNFFFVANKNSNLKIMLILKLYLILFVIQSYIIYHKTLYYNIIIVTVFLVALSVWFVFWWGPNLGGVWVGIQATQLLNVATRVVGTYKHTFRCSNQNKKCD